jgi:hypothetical protein
MRFFAFGCSFTKYHFPTWADILGHEYQQQSAKYYNFGNSGAGNQYIITRIWEANALYNFNKDDTVAICWTNFFREDRFHENLSWHTPGNIFQHLQDTPMPLNNFLYDSQYTWGDLTHCVMRDCALISSTIEGLRQLGVNLIITNILDPFTDDFFTRLPLYTKEQMLSEDFILNSTGMRSILEMYKKYLYQDFPCITEYYEKNVNKDRLRFKFAQVEEENVEEHPLPAESLGYVKEVLSPKYNISISKETEEYVDYWQKRIHKDTVICYPINEWADENFKKVGISDK